MGNIKDHYQNRLNYAATQNYLRYEWNWKPIDQLPDIELTELLVGEYPHSKLLFSCLYNGCTILLGEDKNFYTAYSNKAHKNPSWQDHEYTDFGIFQNPIKIALEIKPKVTKGLE